MMFTKGVTFNKMTEWQKWHYPPKHPSMLTLRFKKNYIIRFYEY